MPKSPHSDIFLHKAFPIISPVNAMSYKKEVYIITMEINHTSEFIAQMISEKCDQDLTPLSLKYSKR